MIGVYREFEGCIRLMGHVLRRPRVLALPPVTEVLTRQFYLDLIGLGRASELRGDRAAARSFYERAHAVSEADRDAKGADEAHALSEALGDKLQARQRTPASSGSNAGQ